MSLEWNFKYEALSYRWSAFNPEAPTYIAIDDVNIPIGADLHAALVQFRQQSVLPRWLWIDQICINQENQEEKRGQIKIMGDIYEKAQRVLVWLGVGDERTDVAMELFPIVMELVNQAEEKSKRDELGTPFKDLVKWRGTLATAINGLFQHPWFGRVWTLQEAALGKEVEIWSGQRCLPFNLLEDFAIGCDNDLYGHWGNALDIIESGSGRSDPEHPSRPLVTHIHVVIALREKQESSALILNTLRSLDCSEHQDRLYSVLRYLDPALVDHLMSFGNLTAPELYHCVAAYGIEHRRMEYFCAAGRSQHRSTFSHQDYDSCRPRLSLPSWVPDWTFTIRTHSYWELNEDCLRKRKKPLYTAGGERLQYSKWTPLADRQTLRGEGIIIDEVSEQVAPFRLARVPENLDNEETNIAMIFSVKASLLSYVTECMSLSKKCGSRYGPTNVKRACRHALVGSMMPDGSSTTRTGVLIRASDEAVDSLFEGFQRCLRIEQDRRNRANVQSTHGTGHRSYSGTRNGVPVHTCGAKRQCSSAAHLDACHC